MKSTSAKYGTVAVTIHWLAAVLILIQLGSGFRAASATDVTIKEMTLSLHVPLGIAVLVLTIARVIWWMLFDQKPNPPSQDPTWQKLSAKAVHVLFYIVIFGMAASGIGLMVASGAGETLTGNSGAPLPEFSEYLPRAPHGFGARLMVLLFVLHASAALYHQFAKRDGLLSRMWFANR